MSSRKCLIVDDDDVIAMSLRVYAETLGCRVTGSATSCEEAFAMLARERPDVVFVNTGLEGFVSGVDTARRIFFEHEIPVIFISSLHQGKIQHRLHGTGCAGFLHKPVRIDDVKHVLNRVFGVPSANDRYLGDSPFAAKAV